MFDIGFSELLLIGVVALIVVGPKDLPMMFRTVGKYVGKAKAMAREFQRSMEDAADATGFKDIQEDLKGVTKGLEDVNKFTNPGFAASKSAKDQFKKILDAKDSGEPLVEDADDSVAGVPEEKPAPKIVEIVEDAPKPKAKAKPKAAAKPKPKAAAKSKTKPKAAAKPKAPAKPKAKKPAAKPATETSAAKD